VVDPPVLEVCPDVPPEPVEVFPSSLLHDAMREVISPRSQRYFMNFASVVPKAES
jgi:hypothetical protein